MKLFTDDMQTGQVANFKFSGVRPEKLGAPEYTLVTLVMDKTGSVSPYANELLEVKKAVVRACQKNARADFLMLRSVDFNETPAEVHGFMELTQVDPSAYIAPHCTGLTALYDATYSAVAATNEYAKLLSDNDFHINGIVFVVTDGDDNRSIQTPKAVAQELKRGIQNEWLESLTVVLIGVNATRYKNELEALKNEGDLTEYVDIGDASPKQLAKLANFIQSNVSSQSQSLGTGGPSQVLSF